MPIKRVEADPNENHRALLRESASLPPVSQQNVVKTLETQYLVKLKNNWQKLLKDCQAKDQKRTGFILQVDFNNALESCALDKVWNI